MRLVGIPSIKGYIGITEVSTMKRLLLILTCCSMLVATMAFAGPRPGTFGLRVGYFHPVGSDLDKITDNWLYYGLQYGAGGVPTPYGTIPAPFGNRLVTLDYMSEDGYQGGTKYDVRLVPLLYRVRSPLGNQGYFITGGLGVSFNDFEVNGVGESDTDFAWELGFGVLSGDRGMLELTYCDLGSGRGLDATGIRLGLTYTF